MKSTNVKKNIELIVQWIKNYLKKARCDGFVFGLSGGIDSSLIAAIAGKFFPNNHLALTMNIDNSKCDIDDANLVIKKFKLIHKDVNLKPVFNTFVHEIKTNTSTYNNIKSRLRMICLYSYAQEKNYLVVGTTNHIELMIGYFTKYGDSGSDIWPLANLLKKDIKLMASYLQVPDKIINKNPSAGFYDGQTDEKEIGLTYKDMDTFFEKKSNEKVSKKINSMIKNSNHKRKIPATPLPIKKIFS